MSALSFPRWRRAWIRFDYRDALAELGVAVHMLLAVGAGPIVMGLFMPGGCE